jgi:hypothetical protein
MLSKFRERVAYNMEWKPKKFLFLVDEPDDYDDVPEDVQVIREYPKQKCAKKGCNRNAVGKGDLCKKHGGRPVVEENLISYHNAPSALVNGSKFDPEKHPRLFMELSKIGKLDPEIAAEFGVSVPTIQHWAETLTEYAYAYEAGQAMQEAWWLSEGKNNLDNRGYNVSLYKFITGNKLGYSDKIESRNLNVHAGVLMVPGSMSLEEWEKQTEK